MGKTYSIDISKVDPMLSKVGVRSAKEMCVDDGDLKNIQISPLYGSFEQFPKTILYAAENDITYPDQILAFEKAKKENVDITLVQGKQMPHIWPFLPTIMKEAKEALHEISTIVLKM